MTNSTTVSAQPDDATAAISALVTAFTNDPFIRWMFPKSDQYLSAFPRVLHYFAGAAFGSGTAYMSEDSSAAALWLPPGVSPDEDGLGQVLEDQVDPAMQDQVFAVMEQVGAGHPEAAHWYLPAMGVDPRSQGQGTGSVVLGDSLGVCDQTCSLAYLESTNPANIPFYRRHGFEIVGEIQVDGSPLLTRMLRKAA